jgi:hypothetical protein
VSSWAPGRLPIAVPPLPGEALESWIAAYARRLHTTGSDLIRHVGLGGTRISQMALRLDEHETAALEQAAGVSRQTLAAMTLEPYDGLVAAIRADRRELLVRPPAGRFGAPRARYCPACLARDDGRGPVTWRLPWSFACPVHRVLLADFCPACHRPPRMWNTRRLGPRAGGTCTRDHPAGGPGRWSCGADLTRGPAVPLPAAGLVLAAHRHLAALMAGRPGDRPAALAELRQVYATAGRIARGLHTIPQQAPPVVAAVLDELGARLPGPADAAASRDARSTAIGAALAVVALDRAHPDHEVLFDWVLQADRSLLEHRQRMPGIGALARRWAWSGPDMVSRVLGRLDGEANLHTRLRYATATARPRWPDLPAQAIKRRATMIPAMLWPGWTMRLLPALPAGAGAPAGGPRTGSASFRRGCASFLLLPGGPPQLNFERAAPLLGNHTPGTSRSTVERIHYHDRDVTPLAAVLAQLAFTLDQHGSPINYARRRALFTTAIITLDLDAYTRLRLQHGWSAGYTPRLAVLRWYLRMLLTGEHPPPGEQKKPFGQHCTSFRFHAPQPLRAFLHQQAQANLAHHDISEPVTWEPPADWVTCPRWPGTDPATISAGHFATVLATAPTVHAAAGTLGLTPEHVRLYCEITGTGTPQATANGIPSAPTRADILDPARLRGLYEDQHLPMTTIAGMAGCATATVLRLLQHDHVPPRRNYRPPPPGSGITRAWLEREYTINMRSISALARERNVTADYLMRLARNWDLPIRGHRDYSGIGHLTLPSPPSPALRAVTMRSGALTRLELITRIPGHDSIAAAASVLYDGRTRALAQMLHQIETAAGFTIIDRSGRPLAPTTAGNAFISEALQILLIAQEQGSRPGCHLADKPNHDQQPHPPTSHCLA